MEIYKCLGTAIFGVTWKYWKKKKRMILIETINISVVINISLII